MILCSVVKKSLFPGSDASFVLWPDFQMPSIAPKLYLLICFLMFPVKTVIKCFRYSSIRNLDRAQCCQIWRLFEPFGDQFFDLAILKFGSFSGYFSKQFIRTCLNRFLAKILELWCRSSVILKLLWCRSFGVFKNLATFCSNFLAALTVPALTFFSNLFVLLLVW